METLQAMLEQDRRRGVWSTLPALRATQRLPSGICAGSARARRTAQGKTRSFAACASDPRFASIESLAPDRRSRRGRGARTWNARAGDSLHVYRFPVSRAGRADAAFVQAGYLARHRAPVGRIGLNEIPRVRGAVGHCMLPFTKSLSTTAESKK